MANAEEYYHISYDQHTEQITSLRKQIRIYEEVLSIDSLQIALKEAVRSGDNARIEKARLDLKMNEKALKKITRQLIFWKVVAIIEGVALLVLTATGLILIYI